MAKLDLRALISGETPRLIGRLIADQGRAHWKGYLVAFACMAGIAASTATAAWLMRDVINEVFLARNQTAIWQLAAAVVAIYAIKGVSTFGQQVTLTRIANAIVATVQRRVYVRLLEMNVAYFTSRHTAEFVARQSFIAQSCGGVLNTVITAIGRDVLSLVGLVAVMIIQDPVMSLIGLTVMPPAVFGVQKLVRRAKAIRKRGFDQGMRVIEAIQETVAGIRPIKSYVLEDHVRVEMNAAIEEVERAANKFASVSSRSTPLMETLGGFAVAGVILYGGWRVVSFGATPGVFFSFITALLLAYEPAKRLARVNVDLAGNMVGVKMMYDFLSEPGVESDPADAGPLAIAGGRVTFSDVRFAYRADEEVLRGLDLVAEAGKTTALVGRSGGGKSTILSLLLRFYEPTSGTIAVDGTDVRTVTRASLRAAIAYVGQDVHLFAGTIRENIAIGRPGASEAEIVAAATAAHAHDFIGTFQNGYDTAVGENGAALSGGQRQRIAIARAILKDAPILLLDEATAALDTESERAIQAALETLSQGRTTLVIAHRLKTIEKADKICVIEQGRVIEEGRHEALLAQGGRYAALHGAHFAA